MSVWNQTRMEYSELFNMEQSLGSTLMNFTVDLDAVVESASNHSSSLNVSGHGGSHPVDTSAIVCISVLFCLIGIVGITGNVCVVCIILTDAKMRRSVTNLFIMNLAVSDLLIMLFGIPEIVQFMINRGWLLGEPLCKLERYVLVASLYSSVITLVAVCVERYIAIVHPLHAHVLCCRRRMLAVILATWPTVLLLSLPIVLYNQVKRPTPQVSIEFCTLRFPEIYYLVTFKYAEFVLFYLVPMLVQIGCYAVIGKHLFAGTAELHRKPPCNGDSPGSGKTSEAMKQRKGVVKMLIASVIIYFVSYSPHQILLFYNTFSKATFHQTWVWIVFVTAMGYINSAASPLMYCVFSQTFRVKFRRIFLKCCHMYRNSADPNATSRQDFQSGATAFTGNDGRKSTIIRNTNQINQESHHLLKMTWKKPSSQHGTFV